VNREPPQDQYFKGALFHQHAAQHRERNDPPLVGAAPRFLPALQVSEHHDRGDVVRYFNQKTGMNLTPVFDEYLRHAELPALEFDVRWGTGNGSPTGGRRMNGVRHAGSRGARGHWQIIQPTSNGRR